MPNAPPPALLAAGDGLVAIDTFSNRTWLRRDPLPDRLVVLRARDGSIVAAVDSIARPLPSLAVSRSWLVAIRIVRATPRLVVWHLPDARRVRQQRLESLLISGLYAPVNGMSALSLRGNILVLHDGISAWTLRLPDGRLRRLARANVREAIALGREQVAWTTCDDLGDRCTIHVAAAP